MEALGIIPAQKCIAYTNSAKLVKKYKDQVDLWLDISFPFARDTPLIIFNLEAEL